MTSITELHELHNLTVKIFHLLLQEDSPMGPNEVKQKLSLNARSKAYYHLNKLYELNLLDKTPDNKYIIHSEVDIPSLLGDYFRVLSVWVPKSLGMGIILLIAALVNVIFLFQDPSFLSSFNTISFLLIGGYLVYDGIYLSEKFWDVGGVQKEES